MIQRLVDNILRPFENTKMALQYIDSRGYDKADVEKLLDVAVNQAKKNGDDSPDRESLRKSLFLDHADLELYKAVENSMGTDPKIRREDPQELRNISMRGFIELMGGNLDSEENTRSLIPKLVGEFAKLKKMIHERCANEIEAATKNLENTRDWIVHTMEEVISRYTLIEPNSILEAAEAQKA